MNGMVFCFFVLILILPNSLFKESYLKKRTRGAYYYYFYEDDPGFVPPTIRRTNYANYNEITMPIFFFKKNPLKTYGYIFPHSFGETRP